MLFRVYAIIFSFIWALIVWYGATEITDAGYTLATKIAFIVVCEIFYALILYLLLVRTHEN